MPAPSAAWIRLVSASRDIMVPVGFAGLPTSTPFNGVCAMRRQQCLAGQRMPGFACCFDQHRLAAERGEDVAVRRIAGHGHRNAVAGLEHGKERQDERARRARGHHDPRRIDVAAVSIAVMPRDPFPQ